MATDKTPIHVRIQNLRIVGWTIAKELTKINLGSKENMQQVRINIDLKHVINSQLVELLKEFKDIFVWTYKDLKGIPLKIAQHWIELDTSIPLVH